MKRLEMTLLLAAAIALATALPFSTASAQDEPAITVAGVVGSALLREVGDYMWKRPEKGQTIYAGDRLRLRQGELELDFPQGSLTVFEQGELELPVELVDGFAEPWRNDLKIFIGSYSFDLVGGATPLLIRTLFGEIEQTGAAKFTLRTTVRGTKLTVFSGKLTVRHRKAIGAQPKVAGPGDSIVIVEKQIRLSRGNTEALSLP